MLIEEIITLISTKNIDNISIDSREVSQGDLFIALKGEKFNGNIFIDDAIKKGAKLIFLKKNLRLKPNIFLT